LAFEKAFQGKIAITAFLRQNCATRCPFFAGGFVPMADKTPIGTLCSEIAGRACVCVRLQPRGRPPTKTAESGAALGWCGVEVNAGLSGGRGWLIRPTSSLPNRGSWSCRRAPIRSCP
jgi:hypothetical protein